jgi:Na+:H+ antiporter, NhaA family
VALLVRGGVWWLPLHIGLGLALWLAMWHSGVSPALAGVAMGLLTPARPSAPPEVARDLGGALAGELAADPRPPRLREMLREARGTVPLAERLAHDLHPVSAFVVVPLFALANAGVSLEREALTAAGAGAVVGGVLAGRVVGKLVGIAAAAWLAVRLGLARRPLPGRCQARAAARLGDRRRRRGAGPGPGRPGAAGAGLTRPRRPRPVGARP